MSVDTHRRDSKENSQQLTVEEVTERFRLEADGEQIPLTRLQYLYPNRSLVGGFTRMIRFPDGVSRHVDVIFDAATPFVAPAVAIRDKSLFLKWPHVESDGVVCTPSAGSSCSGNTFVEIGLAVFKEALTNADRSISGENHSDFFDEMAAYWGQTVGDGGWQVVSCLTPGGDSREIAVMHTTGRTYIADDVRSLRELVSRFSQKAAESIAPQAGYLISLESPLTPNDFPENGNDLRAFIEGADLPCHKVLAASAVDPRKSPVYVLQAHVSDGWFLGAVYSRWHGSNRSNGRGYGSGRAVMPGFREGYVSGAVAKQTLFSRAAAVSLASVQRLDDGVTLSRACLEQSKFTNHRISIAGCGSVGSLVLDLLAKAGAGCFTLVDPETLTTQNLSRHVLGLQHVGEFKATALADEISRDRPWVSRSKAFPKSVESLSEQEWDEFLVADVIVSAIGHAGKENYLAHTARARGFQGSIIFCWLEPFAVAGHTLVSIPGDIHLVETAGYSGAEPPMTASWPTDIKIVRSEGGCGGTFQPYGVASLTLHCSNMARAVLSALRRTPAQSQHTISTVSPEELTLTGGSWCEWWVAASDGCPADTTRRWSCEKLAELVQGHPI